MAKETPNVVKDEKELTPEEKSAKRIALLAELAALQDAPPPTGEPGKKTGEGLNVDYVPFTHGWFTDVEARRKDLAPNGTLMWPHYSLHEIVAAKDEVISINGVPFKIIAGRKCWLPEPHYTAWLDSQARSKQNEIEFAPPATFGRYAGYFSPVHKMGDGPIIKEE